MAYNYNNPSRMVIEESPWATLFKELPTTILAFLRLNQELEIQQANKEYQASREDLKFARQDYLAAKTREDKWRDTMSIAGYSTDHITGVGEEWQGKLTGDIVNATAETKDAVKQLQGLNADLKRWSDKGLQWEKIWASFEDEDSENEYRKFVLEGNLSLNDKGEVVGTGEFAEALKSLSPEELEKLKGENYRAAVISRLKPEMEAIKEWGTLTTGRAAASKISQEGKVSAVKNVINTALTYSGIAGIKSIEKDAFAHPGDYKSKAGQAKLAAVDQQKLLIGKEYEYLMHGQYMPVTEDSPATWEFLYNTMVDDFTVAMPQYQTGGYGSTPGNQKQLNETISRVYLNYQKKLESDTEDANIYAGKALRYLGVDLTNANQLNTVGVTENLESIAYDKEILSSLDNLGDTPLTTALEILENAEEIVPQVTDVAPTEDLQEYQWGLFGGKGVPGHATPKQQLTGAGIFQYGSEGEEPLIRSATPGSGIPVFNPVGFFNQEGKRQPAEPGSYSPRDYDPTISIPQDLSDDSQMPLRSGLYTSTAIGTSPDEYNLDLLGEEAAMYNRRARIYDLVMSQGSSEEVAEKSIPDNSREIYLSEVYLASNVMKEHGITFAEIIQAYRDDGLPDPGDWLIEMFPGIEADLIR